MYIVEGNNGVGKSTLLRLIKKHLSHIEVVQEPVDSWAVGGDESLLAKFYHDTNRWSYTMETYTMLTRVQEHIRVQQMLHPFKIMERSLYSGHYCFARNGYEQACMDDTEWNIYNKWFNFLVPQKCRPPKGFIYLSSDPQVCFDRGVKRNRAGEDIVPLEYYQQLHTQHENYLIKKQGILEELKDVPVLVLDGNFEFENDPEVYNEYFEKIEEFLLNTHPIHQNKEVQETI
jgi:deoxyadenosine/deoxycytidine kinase